MSKTTDCAKWKPVARLWAARKLLEKTQRLGFALSGALVAGALVQRFLFCLVVVHGESMAPQLGDGQVCFVDKALQPVARGDVVVANDGCCQAVKRVVGLPNESLLFRAGKVYVNGRELRESYLPPATRTYPVYQTRFTLGNGQFFLMGDNRGQSEDSRVYGPLPGSAILGKVAR